MAAAGRAAGAHRSRRAVDLQRGEGARDHPRVVLPQCPRTDTAPRVVAAPLRTACVAAVQRGCDPRAWSALLRRDRVADRALPRRGADARPALIDVLLRLLA